MRLGSTKAKSTRELLLGLAFANFRPKVNGLETHKHNLTRAHIF
jgi:hypothetical protein